jgi:hypothetical protein
MNTVLSCFYADAAEHLAQSVFMLGWTAPDGIAMCQAVMFEQSQQGSRPMAIIRIGVDTSKHLFQSLPRRRSV